MVKSASSISNRGTTRPCTPERFSHLHVVVPVEAHRQARIAAVQSGMPFKLYLAQLLMTAGPIGQVVVEAPSGPSTDTAEGTAAQGEI